MVLYSDGVTEAHNVAGEEFGEERLVEVMKRYHSEPADVVLEQIDRRGARTSPTAPSSTTM